jgi:CheY-like chemotaxis protein
MDLQPFPNRTSRRPDPNAEAAVLEALLRRLLPVMTGVYGSEFPAARRLTETLTNPPPDAVHHLRALRLAWFSIEQMISRPGLHLGHAASPDNQSADTHQWGQGDQQDDAEPTSILIVHDRREIAERLVEILTNAGFAIRYVQDCEAAEAAVVAAVPALVISDVLLPPAGGKDGINLARTLIARQIPVLLICSFPVNGEEPGLAFLKREFKEHELIESVHRLLRQQS